MDWELKWISPGSAENTLKFDLIHRNVPIINRRIHWDKRESMDKNATSLLALKYKMLTKNYFHIGWMQNSKTPMLLLALQRLCVVSDDILEENGHSKVIH